MKKLMICAASLAAMAAARPDAVIGHVMAETESGDTEATLKQVSAQLDKLNGDIKKTAENAMTEAKTAGEVANETKARADKLLNQQSELTTTIKALTEKLEGNETRLTDALQNLAAGGRGSDGAETPGQGVSAQHDKIAEFVANGCRGSTSIIVQNAITTATGSGGGLIATDEDPAIVRQPRRRLRFRDLVGSGVMSTDAKRYMRQNPRTDNTGPYAEGAASLASDLGWSKIDAVAKKIGTHIHISEETLEDAPGLASEVDGELTYMLDKEEDRQILAGDGTGENYSGLLTGAAAFVAAPGLPNENPIDRLRLACLQVTLEDYEATAMALSPRDWAAIELIKVTGGATGDARYVFGNAAEGTTPILWGKLVADSNAMTANEFLVGDFAMAATLYDRSEIEVIFSTEHDQNFVEDMVTAKIRRRGVLALKRPLAMVQGNLTFA